MRITPFVVGPFEENTWLLVDEASTGCVLVDPGDEGERLVREVERSGAALQAIWLTHAHIDHIGGIAAVKHRWDVPVYLHPADRIIYDRGAQIAATYGLAFDAPPAPDRELREGEALSLGAMRFTVMHTPGHAPGHVTIHGHGVAFVGDCLFAGSVGRTDLPLCDSRALVTSLERITALAEETVVLPGHGPRTTIGVELQRNPFLNGMARVVGG
jgi:hydroxyacylglutathione hydrolase